VAFVGPSDRKFRDLWLPFSPFRRALDVDCRGRRASHRVLGATAAGRRHSLQIRPGPPAPTLQSAARSAPRRGSVDLGLDTTVAAGRANSAHRSAPACHSRLTPPQSHNLFSEQRLRSLPWRPPISPTRRALGSSPLLRPQPKHPCVRCMFSAHSRRQLHPPHGLSTHRTHVQVWFHFSCFLIFHHSAITDRRLGCGHTADYQHLPTRCTRVRAFHAAEPKANKKNRETRRWNCG